MNLAQFPVKLQFLFQPSRYKVLLGGRGGAKSWGIARALLLMGTQRKLKILCARETQKSIADSVHALLKGQIEAMGLQSFYDIQKATILGANGTQLVFFGLKHNVDDIKSCEGVDICWVEEAESVTKGSWDVLIPTIRKDASEIWISFNPKLATDETYKRFVTKPPTGAVVVRISWRDNPWFPDVLKQEMIDCRLKSEDDYQHIWEGACVSLVAGAIYAEQLRRVDAEGRICRVPYDPGVPVQTFWDLGVDDSTSIWFVQQIGFEFHLIDYLEGTGQGLPYYLKALQDRPYLYSKHHLPHDARARELGTGKSIEELMRAAGKPVVIVPMLSVADGINAGRAIMDRCYFDADRCADGLQGLRHYRYGDVEERGVKTKQPIHDWASHPADAYRYFAVGIRPPAPKKDLERSSHRSRDAYSWMG